MLSPRAATAVRQLLQPALLSQVISAGLSFLQLALLSRGLPRASFGVYSSVAAMWAVANAFAGIGVGTRVMRDTARRMGLLIYPQDVCRTIFVVLATYLLSVVLGFGVPVASAAALGTAGFVLAEIRNSAEIGQERYWNFCARFVSRMAIGVGVLAVVSEVGHLSTASGLLAIAAGNLIAACAPPFVGIQFRLSTHHDRLSAVGWLSLGLWVLASADKLVLAYRLPISALAVYAFAYSLIDRAFRVPTTAYTSRVMPRAFVSGHIRAAVKFRLAALALAPLVLTAVFLITPALSGSRYHASWPIAAPLVGGLLCFALAAPEYVAAVQTNPRQPAVLVCVLGVANIAVNFLGARHFGVIIGAWSTFGCYIAYLTGLFVINRLNPTTDALTRSRTHEVLG